MLALGLSHEVKEGGGRKRRLINVSPVEKIDDDQG